MIYGPTDNAVAVETPPAPTMTPVVPAFLRTPRMGGDGNVRDAAPDRQDAAPGRQDDDVGGDADVVADADEPPPLSPATIAALALMEEPGDEAALDAMVKRKAALPMTEDGAEALVRRFDSERQSSIGFGITALFRSFGRVDWLDAADPADLPAAADEIVLAQAARLAIRSCARVENAWRVRVLRQRDTAPLDSLTQSILQERGQAVAFYLELRERQARVAHIESLNREKGAGARRRRPAKPAPRTPATKG